MMLDSPQSAARRRRRTVLGLLAAALVVLGITLALGLRTEIPATPVVTAHRRAAEPPPALAVPPSRVPEAAPPSPEAPAPAAAEAPAEPESTPAAPVEGAAPSVPDAAGSAASPAPAPAAAKPPMDDAAFERWMRLRFGQFLDQAGPDIAALTEKQRNSLFAEFLAWRRARAADAKQGAAPKP